MPPSTSTSGKPQLMQQEKDAEVEAAAAAAPTKFDSANFVNGVNGHGCVLPGRPVQIGQHVILNLERLRLPHNLQ